MSSPIGRGLRSPALAVERALLEGAPDQTQDGIDVERLDHVVERAEPNGLDRGLGIVDAGDDCDRDTRVERFDAWQDVHARRAWHLLVERHNVDAAVPKDSQRAFAIGSLEHFTGVLENCSQREPDGLVVVNDEDGAAARGTDEFTSHRRGAPRAASNLSRWGPPLSICIAS